MKTLMMTLISLIALSANANTPACMSTEEATEILLSQEREILRRLKDDHDISLCKGKPNQGCITRTYLAQRLLQTTWSQKDELYISGSLHTWQCAAGADCWVHAAVDCNKQLDIILDGD